ncbi:MFS transporter (macronuclear) [Tetrahymena thermophila SB210]|uniref:Lysosomal dipeptide transporter MFSD1 n=1 Tax=Tetrahymena thermophila (strain SB210) TaxID=312017 RepID=I7MCL0_TETTS|nr:MFS transporter [Tetrahymena thermophila SB210]EAR84147.2 MFS transporter [Tetrahymena thermophila SB210]|eukprot:XP_001031810.2 MFS transporter [Tetrahymena thermophila SB210]
MMDAKNVNLSATSDYNEQDTFDDNNALQQRILSQDGRDSKQENPYIQSKRIWMLPMVATVLFGAYFSVNFQSFVKEQLMSSMNMSNSDYSLFVLIPTLPNIPLPLLIGPLLDSIGPRLGVTLFTFLLSVGMAICMISISTGSFFTLLIGKTILQTAVECQGIAHGGVVGKWFTAKGLAFAFTLTSLFCKIASSTSGIIYPQLYNINDNLMAPMSLGIALCAITLIQAFVIFYFDKHSENYNHSNSSVQSEGTIVQKKKFKLSDFKKFDRMFWMYAIQCPMMFGAFYAFENYLQSVLIHKFLIEKTLAGELVSIPYWIAFSTPIFGFLADKFGLRCIFLGVTTFLSFISVFILWLLPTGENDFVVYTALIIFGIFLSAMCAFLYPTLPLISQKELLSTAFAICYTTKNGGLALLNYLSGLLLGDDDQGYNSFLLCYVILFFISLCLSGLIYYYDRKHGSIINSTTPQRYIDYVVVKRQNRQMKKLTEEQFEK